MSEHTASSYSAGCRCQDCREAHRLQNRELRERKKPVADATVRASALSVVGADADELRTIVTGWSIPILQGVVMILASLVDPETPVSRFRRVFEEGSTA